LKQYANSKGMVVDEAIEDIGSGQNYNRKKCKVWVRLV
jgi:hypothetical protein